MSKKSLKSALLLTVLVVLATMPTITLSCTSQPAIEPYNFFKASSNYAEISGYSAGYMPGDNATFTIGLKNPTEQKVQGEFCLLLLDREGVVAKIIERRPYALNKKSSFSSPEPVIFPSTLPEGPYGLALLVPEYDNLVVNIWVGSWYSSKLRGLA